MSTMVKCNFFSTDASIFLTPGAGPTEHYHERSNLRGLVSVTIPEIDLHYVVCRSASYRLDWNHVGDHNYCRNPESSSGSGVWCPTTDPAVSWEYCPVPICKYYPVPFSEYCPIPLCEYCPVPICKCGPVPICKY